MANKISIRDIANMSGVLDVGKIDEIIDLTLW